MNTLQTILVAACASGGAACFLFSLAYRFRNELRQLHERWLKMSPLSRAMCILALSVAVLYGGTKPPSSTNEPPSGIEGNAPATTNEPPEIVDSDPAPTNQPPPVLMARRLPSVALAKDGPRLVLSAPPPSYSSQSTYSSQLVTNWTARGAYCDWLRIDFPDSFEFPYGTNLLTGVTLMAYGELRESLAGSSVCSFVGLDDTQSTNQLTNQLTLSLVPGESSCVYGLTPSNTFLFSWSNVCVNRDPTNRVDASIELFQSGDIQIITQPLTTNYQPPTTNYYPAQPPPGFVGSNQDDAWLAAAFSPTDFAAITNLGYSAWLDEDYVGFNEQNGHYRADITVASLPDSGVPCYLVCGPYKVVVSQPGTYSFPLEVFKPYKVRTYPIALPLSISTDDGYRGAIPPALLSYACCSPAPTSNAKLPTPSQLSGAPVLTASRPRLALAAPPPDTPPEYEICEEPRLVIAPTEIPLNQAVGTHISIWCNVASTARRYYAWFSREFKLNFCNPSDAEIVAAEVEDLVEIMIDAPLGTCVGTITITDNDLCCGCGSCTDSGCTCGCDCWRHSQSNDTPTNSPSATP